MVVRDVKLFKVGEVAHVHRKFFNLVVRHIYVLEIDASASYFW